MNANQTVYHLFMASQNDDEFGLHIERRDGRGG